MKYAVLPIVFAVALISPSQAKTTAGFDKPSDVKRVVAPAKGDTPKATITCSYYSRFMVKMVDEGEVGAAQLSVVPSEPAHKPKCEHANAANEKVVDVKEWSGYFKGVKGDFIVFDAGDGTNGAMGFAVFEPDAKKLFEDSVLGRFHALTADDTTLTMTYQRSVAGPCSVAKDGAACWTKIAAATGLKPESAPDCAGGYLKAKTEMAKARCKDAKTPTKACTAKALKELDEQKWDESPSVIVYEAKTVIASGKATTTALGAPLSCRPAD